MIHKSKLDDGTEVEIDYIYNPASPDEKEHIEFNFICPVGIADEAEVSQSELERFGREIFTALDV